MQIGAINSFSQNIVSLHNKLSDMEINSSAVEDTVRDLVESQNGVNHELQEIRQGVEAIKFYSFNFLANGGQV
ncbi:hypothetical protein D3C71_1880630 [compost metagenome]